METEDLVLVHNYSGPKTKQNKKKLVVLLSGTQECDDF